MKSLIYLYCHIEPDIKAIYVPFALYALFLRNSRTSRYYPFSTPQYARKQLTVQRDYPHTEQKKWNFFSSNDLEPLHVGQEGREKIVGMPHRFHSLTLQFAQFSHLPTIRLLSIAFMIPLLVSLSRWSFVELHHRILLSALVFYLFQAFQHAPKSFLYLFLIVPMKHARVFLNLITLLFSLLLSFFVSSHFRAGPSPQSSVKLPFGFVGNFHL